MPVMKIIALTQFTFYNTVPYGLIKEKLNKLIEQTFKRADSLCLFLIRTPIFTSEKLNIIMFSLVGKFAMLSIIFWIIFIGIGPKLHRQKK